MFKKLGRFLLHPLMIRLFIAGIIFLIAWYAFPHLEWLGVSGSQKLPISLTLAVVVYIVLIIGWIQQTLSARAFEKGLKGQGASELAKAEEVERPELQELNRIFGQAIGELNEVKGESRIPGIGGMYALPWVLVLGPPAAGKTSALQFSPLRFTTLGRNVAGVGGTRNCTWWLSEELVVLDTAGRYSVRANDRDEWLRFLHLLREHRPDKPIHGAVVQVGIDTLLESDPAHLEETAHQLRERLQELILQLEVRFPVHLVFSKCDQLDGFTTYFEGLSREERDKPWGFHLDIDQLRPGELGETFARHYQAMLERLLPHQGSRINQLGNIEKRDQALAFPQEMSSRARMLSHFVSLIFEPRRNLDSPWLRSVMFCSALPSPPPPDGLRHRQFEALELQPPGSNPGQPLEGTYFLTGVYQEVQRLANLPLRLSRRGRHRRLMRLGLTTLCASLLAFLVSCYLGHDYVSRKAWIEEVTQRSAAIAEISRADIRTIAELDEVLSHLERLDELLNDRTIGGVSEPARTAYYHAIDYYFILPQRERLEKYLQKAASYSPQAPDADTVFINGFHALKSNYILRGETCKGMRPEGKDASQFMGRYFADLYEVRWREDNAITAKTPEQDSTAAEDEQSLQHNLNQIHERVHQFFADEQRSRLILDRTQKGLAKEAEKAMGRSPSASLFITLLGYEKDQLTPQTLLAQPIAKDNGIRQIYWQNGCNLIKDPGEQVEQWFGCVLPGASSKIEWEDTYKLQYQRAWASWLQQVSTDSRFPLAPHGANNGGDRSALLSAITTLNHLTGSSDTMLSQMLFRLGDTNECVQVSSQNSIPGGLSNSSTAQKANRTMGQIERAIDAVEKFDLCQQSMDPFCSLQKEFTRDSALKNAWILYEGRMTALSGELRDIHDNSNLHKQALELVKATMDSRGKLHEAGRARDDFFRELSQEAIWRGFEPATQSQMLQGWNQVNLSLLKLEKQIWQVLVRLAAPGLQDRWQVDVLDKWSATRMRAGEAPADVCVRYDAFRLNVLDPFIAEWLDPYYDSNRHRSCRLKMFNDASLPLCAPACSAITDFRDFRLSCQAGEGEAVPLVVTGFNVDSFASGVAEVRLDTGREIFSYDVFRNNTSTLRTPTTGHVTITLLSTNRREVIGDPIRLDSGLDPLVRSVIKGQRPGRIDENRLLLTIPASRIPIPNARAASITITFAEPLIKPGPAIRPTSEAELRSLHLPESVSCL